MTLFEFVIGFLIAAGSYDLLKLSINYLNIRYQRYKIYKRIEKGERICGFPRHK